MAKASCNVAVIGAGVIGCSVALHLLEAGVRDVVVLERDDVAQATSAAGAGFIGEWAIGWDPKLGAEELAMERYGLRFYASLAGAGSDLDHRSNGNLYLARTEEDFERDVAPLLEGVPDARRLSPAAVGEATGGMVAADRIAGGVLHPSGGQLSARKAARVLAQRFHEGGGVIHTRAPVERIVVEGGRVAAVETNMGTLACEHVVVAAGAWANTLLRPLDVFLPYVPLVAFRVVTEPLGVPDTMPTLMMRRPGFYAREEAGGLLWSAMYTTAPRRSFVAIDPPERFDQLPLDGYLQLRDEREQELAQIVPAFGRARSATVAFGAPTYTPDGRPLIGPVPGIDGLVVASGCNEGGVTHGPGFGRLIAELIADGQPALCSLEPFAIDRFGDRYTSTADVAGSASY